MSDCLFCNSFVGEESGDGGCKGRTIGTKDICEQCLSELKYVLERITPKSPSTRETKTPEDSDDFENSTNESSAPIDEQIQEELREEDENPFSSAPKE
ncbi:MAG: hypothetical protein WCW44_04735 [archaeon]|jgi:hypothetical protein